MKILQLVPYFYPAWAYGGPGKLVYDTSCYFANQGHQVTVYTSDAYDKNHRMSVDKHVNIKNLKVNYFTNFNNHLTYTYNIFFTPSLYWQAWREIKNFDVIHLHDFYTLQNFFVGFICRILKKPYILSVHGCLEEQRIKQQNLFKKFFLNLYGYQLLKHASKIIASSKNEIKAYKAFGIKKEKIEFLGHGIILNEFESRIDKIKIRKKLGFSKDQIIITFLGRIHKIKGLDRLVETISLISDKKIVFIIAGSDDGFLLELKKSIAHYKIEKRVKLIGACFGRQKILLFKLSDIFIYPSYSEGFSLGVLEAAAAGLPLILSTGCHFEEVATKKAGLVVQNNSKSLKTAILKLANNQKLRQEFGKNAKKLIKNKYSMKIIGNKLLNIYEKLI